MKTLIVYYENNTTQTLSYQIGWVSAFKNTNLFDCDFLNLDNFFPFQKKIPNIQELNDLIFKNYDCIILLHSVFSNSCVVPFYIQKIIRHKKAFKVFFVGNEYKHMPEKINFTKYLKINLFITQSHLQTVIDLYKGNLNINVEHISNIGIDEKVFFPKIEFNNRKIFAGYRSYLEPLYLGNVERLRLYNFLKKYSTKKNDYIFDISVDIKDRFSYHEWAQFLNNCKCFVSPNTGTDYFFLNDDLRNRVNESKLNNFDQIYEKFFKNQKKGTKFRCLTGKVIEPAACKTALILVEGDYDKFKPNIHYIPLKQDYSNMDECLDKLNDNSFSKSIINNSYDLVKAKYLYKHHLIKLFNIINKII
ncbi:hypothetical protein OAI09_01285 [Candidatus Pelagibacter sp.]|nr:hypothetical protein [Candidatus Pelagibacter sp.]